MTSIRCFTEILLDTPDADRERSKRYPHIIHDETQRLTRLLDGILDLGVLERGDAAWTPVPADPQSSLATAIGVCQGLAESALLRLPAP